MTVHDIQIAAYARSPSVISLRPYAATAVKLPYLLCFHSRPDRREPKYSTSATPAQNQVWRLRSACKG